MLKRQTTSASRIKKYKLNKNQITKITADYTNANSQYNKKTQYLSAESEALNRLAKTVFTKYSNKFENNKNSENVEHKYEHQYDTKQVNRINFNILGYKSHGGKHKIKCENKHSSIITLESSK